MFRRPIQSFAFSTFAKRNAPIMESISSLQRLFPSESSKSSSLPFLTKKFPLNEISQEETSKIMEGLPSNLKFQDIRVFQEEKPRVYVKGEDVLEEELTVTVLQGPFTVVDSSLKKIELPDFIFRTDVRPDVLSRVVRWQRNKKQQGTHKTKTKAEVSGTGRKPWAQKGTGRARQGSLRNPHFRGGGTAFGPVVRSHAHKLNKKERRLGLRSAIAARFQEKQFFIVDTLKPENEYYDVRKQLFEFCEKNKLEKVLFVDVHESDIIRSNFDSSPDVEFLPAAGCNVLSILKKKTLIFSVEGLNALEIRLDEQRRREKKWAIRGVTLNDIMRQKDETS